MLSLLLVNTALAASCYPGEAFPIETLPPVTAAPVMHATQWGVPSFTVTRVSPEGQPGAELDTPIPIAGQIEVFEGGTGEFGRFIPDQSLLPSTRYALSASWNTREFTTGLTEDHRAPEADGTFVYSFHTESTSWVRVAFEGRVRDASAVWIEVELSYEDGEVLRGLAEGTSWVDAGDLLCEMPLRYDPPVAVRARLVDTSRNAVEWAWLFDERSPDTGEDPVQVDEDQDPGPVDPVDAPQRACATAPSSMGWWLVACLGLRRARRR